MENNREVYFDKSKNELEKKIQELLKNQNQENIKTSLVNTIIENNLNEKIVNNFIDKIERNDYISVIIELLLYYDNDLSNTIFKNIFNIGINNDNTDLKDIVNNLREIITNNNKKINELFNNYIKKPLEIKQNNQQSNDNFNYIETVQSDMADSFKNDFNFYIKEDKSDYYDSWYDQYLHEKIEKNELNSYKALSFVEFTNIWHTLLGYQYADKQDPIIIKTNQLGNNYGHFVLAFNENYLDDSIAAGVQTDNCCGVYAAHMSYIAKMIYNKIIESKVKFDFNIFKTVYNKYRTIYIKNARQNDNLDQMKKINCKNRLCIAMKKSLDQLDGYISKDVYNKLLNEIKEEIEKSFITEDMKNELENLDNNINIEIKKAEIEKLKFKKEYIENFRVIENNSKNINNNIEKIKRGYYEKKLKEIDNIKKIVNINENKNKINDLITNGKISNKEIMGSILSGYENNNPNIIINNKNFSEAVLPNVKIGEKTYSGFDGEANYNNNNKTFTIKYNEGGFFDDKLNLMTNLSKEFKESLKQGLTIKLKDTQDNKKLLEIFTLLKTNPVLALLELNNISEKIYLGNNEIKNNKKDFNELVNVFGTISESRRQITKLDNIIKTKEKKEEEKVETLTDKTICAEIEIYICNLLKESLINNEKAEKIINLTEFKDINIIVGQSLEFFKLIEKNNENLQNIFDNSEQQEKLDNLLNVFKKESEEKVKLNAFMNCFNTFINFKLNKVEKKINELSTERAESIIQNR